MSSATCIPFVSYLDEISRQALEILAGMQPLASSEHGSFSPVIESWVRIDGEAALQSQLLVRADLPFALRFSECFLGTSVLSEKDLEVTDALQELANTIGGNFKGLLSSELRLSIPETFVGSRQRVHNDSLATFTYNFAEGGCCTVDLLGPDLSS